MFALKTWFVIILVYIACFKNGVAYHHSMRKAYRGLQSPLYYRTDGTTETAVIKEGKTKESNNLLSSPPPKPSVFPESSLNNIGKIIHRLKQTILSKQKKRKPWTESLLDLRKVVLGGVTISTQYAGESLMNKLDRIHELQSTEISNTMWLLGFLANKLPGMNIKPTTFIADEIISVYVTKCEHNRKRGIMLSNNEISSFLIGLGRLGLMFDNLLSSQQLISLVEINIHSFSDDDLSSMIHSFGKMKVDQRKHLPISFKNTLYSRLSEVIPFANSRALSSALWGLSKCNFRWEDFPPDVKQCFLAAVSSLDGSESRQATANIFLSLGQMGLSFADVSPVQFSMFQTSVQKLPKRQMKLQDMIQIFHGLGKMKCSWQSLSPSAQFALAESWYLAIQFYLTQEGKNKRFQEMKSIPVIDPLGTGIVLNQLADMGIEWSMMPVPLKAGLMLSLVYADNSSVVSQNGVVDFSHRKVVPISTAYSTIGDGEEIANTIDSHASSHVVMELQRLEKLFLARNMDFQDPAEQHSLEQQYLSQRQKVKTKTKAFSGFIKSSPTKVSDKQEECSVEVVARSIATIFHSLSRMKVLFHDIHPQAKESLFRLLLKCVPTSKHDSNYGNSSHRTKPPLRGRSLSLLLTGMAEMGVSWSRDLPTKVQDLLWYSALSLPLNNNHSFERNDGSNDEGLSKGELGENADNLIQVVFMSLEALVRMNFPFHTIDKTLLDTLMVISFKSICDKTTSSQTSLELKKLIGGGRTLLRLSSQWQTFGDENSTDYLTVVSGNVKDAFLNALSHVLQNTGDNHNWFVEYFYVKEQLTVRELVSLLETLGDMRCSLKDKELASYPVRSYQASLNPNGNTSAVRNATIGSLLSVSKIIAAEIFSNRSNSGSLSGYVLTVEALANLGHKWPHVSPRLQRKLINGFLAQQWNSGSLMCLFLSSLGRLKYPWWNSHGALNSTNAAMHFTGGNRPGHFEQRILGNLHNVLKANAVTNVKSWAALFRGISSLGIPFEGTPSFTNPSVPFVNMSFQRLLLRRLLYSLYAREDYQSMTMDAFLYPNIAWSSEEQQRKANDVAFDAAMLSSSAGCLKFTEQSLRTMDMNEKRMNVKLLTNIVTSFESIFGGQMLNFSQLQTEDIDTQILTLAQHIQNTVRNQWCINSQHIEKRKSWAPKSTHRNQSFSFN